MKIPAVNGEDDIHWTYINIALDTVFLAFWVNISDACDMQQNIMENT